jgi:hypothetical protein
VQQAHTLNNHSLHGKFTLLPHDNILGSNQGNGHGMPERSCPRRRMHRNWQAVAQAALLLLAAPVFAMTPQAGGPVLALPLAGQEATALITADTPLLGHGRLPGSLVLGGARPGFWDALTRHAVLILPALPALCGSSFNQESRS